MIYQIKYKISHLWNRLICHLIGCKAVTYYSNRMPDDWTPPTGCKRCGACDDVYRIEETDFCIIYETESIFGILKTWIEDRIIWR